VLYLWFRLSRRTSSSIGFENDQEAEMRKSLFFGLIAVLALVCAVPTQAAIISTTASGPMDADVEPDGFLDNWEGNPAAPTAGNADTWVVGHNMTLNTTWYGGTTQVDSGYVRASAAAYLQDVVLNGGAIEHDNVNAFLYGDTLTLNSGYIRKNRKNSFTVSFDDYVGAGTIIVTGNNPQSNKKLLMTSTLSDAFDDFTGTFSVELDNGTGVAFGFDMDITKGTFGILLTDRDGISQPTPDATGRYVLSNDVSVQSFRIKDYQDVDDGTGTLVRTLVLDYGFAPGTYTLDTAANPGAIDLTSLDGRDFSPFFVNSSGTFTVVPEPATLSLLALGLIPAILRKRRKA
jgi:hypothetical protein